MREKIELLKHHTRGGQDFAFFFTAGINGFTIFGLHQKFILDGNTTLVDGFQFIDAAQKGALAGAGRADNGQHFATAHFNINAL